MSGSSEEGKEPGHQRGKNRNVLRIRTNNSFCHRHQKIDASGRVHRRGCCHNSKNDQQHINRRGGRLHAEKDRDQEQTDAAPDTETNTVKPRADKNHGKHDHELNPEKY